MNSVSRIVALVSAVMFLAAACSRSDTPTADPAAAATATAIAASENDDTPAPTEPPAATPDSADASDADDGADAPVDDPTPEPTEAPVVELSDDERIAAATDALDATGAASLVAWDVLESSVLDDGQVELILCGWEGDSAFDSVYRSRWRVETDDDGHVAATERATSLHTGECLNGELVASAFLAIRAYDEFWAQVLQDPAIFADDQRRLELFSDTLLPTATANAERWAGDGAVIRRSAYESALPDALAAELLFRRFSAEGGSTTFVEFVACRDQDPDYGLYVADVLVDQFKGDGQVGSHSIVSYRLTPDPDNSIGWRFDNVAGRGWVECGSAEAWAAAASAWRPEVVDFDLVDLP